MKKINDDLYVSEEKKNNCSLWINIYKGLQTHYLK